MYKVTVKGECYIKSNTGTEEKDYEVTMDVNLPIYKVIRDEKSNKERLQPMFGRVLSHIRDVKENLLVKAIRKSLGAGVRLAHKSQITNIEWHGPASDIQSYEEAAMQNIDNTFNKYRYTQEGELTLAQLDQMRALKSRVKMQVKHLENMLPKTKPQAKAPQSKATITAKSLV